MLIRKYWVSFRVANSKGQHIGQGELAISRELPITDEQSLVEIARVIRTNIAPKDVAPEDFIVQVISWIKFEESSVVLANSGDVKKLLEV